MKTKYERMNREEKRKVYKLFKEEKYIIYSSLDLICIERG